MDKHKENGILFVCEKMIKYNEEVMALKKETELYNDIYREISEIIGLDATLKVYLRFKGRNLSRVSPKTLLRNLSLINNRPRKCLNYISAQDSWNLELQNLS